MATYTVTATRDGTERQRWDETSQRRACQLARNMARELSPDLDDIYVTEAGGRLIYHLHRITEGDGLAWRKAKA